MKNASLSSRPTAWPLSRVGWDYPTTSARLSYMPSEHWVFGVSASEGAYLLGKTAVSTLPRGYTPNNYREIVLGQDIAWLWRQWEVWAEIFEARFQVPLIGNADTLAYYVETRYEFDARWFFSTRWNQEQFDRVPNGTPAGARWGANTWRIDAGPTLRLSAHTQLKLQYSYERTAIEIGRSNHLIAGQFTARF